MSQHGECLFTFGDKLIRIKRASNATGSIRIASKTPAGAPSAGSRTEQKTTGAGIHQVQPMVLSTTSPTSYQPRHFEPAPKKPKRKIYFL